MDQYVVKKAEIDNLEGLNKQHFLNPEGQRTNKSLGDLVGLTGLGFHLIEVPPGKESTEYHNHHYEDECVYILSGEGVVVINDETTGIGPGDFIGYRAGGWPHTMKNTGDSPLVCLCAGERRKHEVVDYPRKGRRLFYDEKNGYQLVDSDNIGNPGAGKKS